MGDFSFTFFFDTSSLLKYGLPLLFVYLLIIFRDVVLYSELRPEILYGLFGIFGSLVILSTTKKKKFISLERLNTSFIILILLMLTIFFINYLWPSVEQREFASSMDYHGRFYIGASSNPIWTAYLAAMLAVFWLSTNFLLVVSSAVLFLFLYKISVNEAQWLVLPIIFIIYFLRNHRISHGLIFIVTSLLIFATSILAYFALGDFFKYDPSASQRVYAISLAIDKFTLFGDPDLVFYVDVPFIELFLEIGILAAIFYFFMFYIFTRYIQYLQWPPNQSIFFPVISAILIATIAQTHYRPFDYSYFIPMTIYVYWYAVLSKNRNFHNAN